jgi:hypothetical protein
MPQGLGGGAAGWCERAACGSRAARPPSLLQGRAGGAPGLGGAAPAPRQGVLPLRPRAAVTGPGAAARDFLRQRPGAWPGGGGGGSGGVRGAVRPAGRCGRRGQQVGAGAGPVRSGRRLLCCAAPCRAAGGLWAVQPPRCTRNLPAPPAPPRLRRVREAFAQQLPGFSFTQLRDDMEYKALQLPPLDHAGARVCVWWWGGGGQQRPAASSARPPAAPGPAQPPACLCPPQQRELVAYSAPGGRASPSPPPHRTPSHARRPGVGPALHVHV